MWSLPVLAALLLSVVAHPTADPDLSSKHVEKRATEGVHFVDCAGAGPNTDVTSSFIYYYEDDTKATDGPGGQPPTDYGWTSISLLGRDPWLSVRVWTKFEGDKTVTGLAEINDTGVFQEVVGDFENPWRSFLCRVDNGHPLVPHVPGWDSCKSLYYCL